MSDIVILAENLGKKYIIGHQAGKERYATLRDVLARNAKSLWNKTRDLAKGKAIIQGDTTEEFWALKDVSFEIRRGEAVGIIGRNGAGKSTLLKVLSRITEPSAGRVTIKGRVASLLEVGTGFHPELSGRENIFLNGGILGMTRREIKARFDEIVDFAGVEKYLDTPVKRYSSGMYVRLAFSVAAHLEPEIMVVDEVLAVGDAAFQKKCLGKMEDVAKGGRTVLFVSHHMNAIQKLCPRAVLLRGGRVEMDADADLSIKRYLSEEIGAHRTIEWPDERSAPRSDEIVLRAIRVVDESGNPASLLSTAQPVSVEIEYKLAVSLHGLRVYLELSTEDGVPVFSSSDLLVRGPFSPRRAGRYKSRCTIPGKLLNVGNYVLSIGADVPNEKVLIPSRQYLDFAVTTLIDNPMGPTSRRLKGVVKPELQWGVEELD